MYYNSYLFKLFCPHSPLQPVPNVLHKTAPPIILPRAAALELLVTLTPCMAQHPTGVVTGVRAS